MIQKFISHLHTIRRFRTACVLLFLFLSAGCGKKEAVLPKPEFPISEDTLSETIETLGLPLMIEQAEERSDDDGTAVAVRYSLRHPDSSISYNTLFINSYVSEDLGRRLQMTLHVPEKKIYEKEDPVGKTGGKRRI